MAAADCAKQQAWARAERVGATGFCGGGALALHFSAEYPGVTPQNYKKEAAEDAWKRCVAFFDTYLKA